MEVKRVMQPALLSQFCREERDKLKLPGKPQGHNYQYFLVKTALLRNGAEKSVSGRFYPFKAFRALIYIVYHCIVNTCK